MSFNSNDNLVLVAPRPVRLATGFSSFSPVLSTRAGAAAFRVLSTAPSDAFERLRLADDGQDTKDNQFAQPDSASPRASPRASVQSEALEEFLSILRPASLLYPPTSPILRATARRNNGTMSVIPYERPHPYKRDRYENEKSPQSPSPSRNRHGVCATPLKSWSSEEKRDLISEGLDHEAVFYPFEWRNYDVLSSPINRAHARNPFHRQASYDQAAVAGQVFSHMSSPSDSLSTPSPRQTLSPCFITMSPAAIPLPSPSPDEAMELDSMS